MQNLVLALTYLVCVTYARRLQTSKPAEPLPDRPLVDSRELLKAAAVVGDWQSFSTGHKSETDQARVKASILASLLLACNPSAAFNFCVQRTNLALSSPVLTSSHPVASFKFSPLLSPRSGFRHTSTRLSDSSEGQDAKSDADLWAALRARQEELDTDLVKRWRKADCKSWGIAVNSWVRRVALDWPRAAIGTYDGQIIIKDLTSGDDIASLAGVHPTSVATDASRKDMFLLHGEYDGGGLTAIALHGDVVVSAGRDGGAKLWRLVSSATQPEKEQLQLEQTLKTASAAAAAVVSKIIITDGQSDDGDGVLHIWLACLDGAVQRWTYFVSDQTVFGSTLTLKAESAVLDIAILEERRLIGCATATGVELFSTDTGVRQGEKWQPTKMERARSIAFVPVIKEGMPLKHCLLVGDSNGYIRARYLCDADLEESLRTYGPFEGPPTAWIDVEPKHNGACVALTPLGSGKTSGLFISGAHDGTCGVWDVDWTLDKGTPVAPKTDSSKLSEGAVLLYGLQGYKVWLGSVATDGKRIVSDGCDNVVLIMDFSEASE